VTARSLKRGRFVRPDITSIELELFREFERAELRRLETRRVQAKRPRTPTNTADKP